MMRRVYTMRGDMAAGLGLQALTRLIGGIALMVAARLAKLQCLTTAQARLD